MRQRRAQNGSAAETRLHDYSHQLLRVCPYAPRAAAPFEQR
jgi:hypothetical protein